MPGLSFISRRVQGAVAAGVPCVSGKFNRARDRASGTVTFGKHGRWTWSAGAIGTVGGGGG